MVRIEGDTDGRQEDDHDTWSNASSGDISTGASWTERIRGEVSVPVEKVITPLRPRTLLRPYKTKSEVKDEPKTEEEIVGQGRASREELLQVKQSSMQVYELLRPRAADAGFILADIKLEFGRHGGEILLGDSIGPDEFRMWPMSKYEPGKTQESYDKQPIRDWLISMGYKAELDRARKAGAGVPLPPKLPDWLVAETSQRYIAVYESLTGLKL